MNDQNTNVEITWLDEKAERLFSGAGLVKFADLWNAESKLDASDVRVMREHRDKRGSGKVDRSVLRLNLSDGIFYLKRSFGEAYSNLKHEYEAMKVLPRFGLRPSELAASAFDDERRTGLLVLKNLNGFNSINDFILGNVSDEVAADFAGRKDVLLAKVAEIIKEVHSSGYIYPDWFGKHIFIEEGGDEIALIDLERFRPLSECPWYFGFPITSWFVKRKILRKLRRSLKSDLIPADTLKRFF